MNEITKTAKKIEATAAAIAFDHRKDGAQTKNLEEIDAAKLQTELKIRMKLFDRLMNEGHNIKDIAEVRRSLELTIRELDELIEDPTVDKLSEEIG